MTSRSPKPTPDFKGIGHSKIGFFKEIRSKIKELEKLNIELARRHQKLEAIFNNMNDGLTILDRDMTIASVNQVQKSMFPGMELVGRKCHKAYFHKSDICKHCPAVKTVQDQQSLRGEVFVKSGDHSGRYYEWTTSPLRDPAGKVYQVILLMRDITERKDYEYKLMQADRMAAIGFLAAGIAHEINNPLTSIAGFSEGLMKRLKKAEHALGEQQARSFKEYLEIINSEAYRCKEIIHNLKDFSLSATDDFEILPIDRIIKDTVSLFRQRAKDQNIKINYNNHLTRGLDAVRGIESQLKHLFLNLLIRAFKSIEEGGELHLSSSNEGDQIRVALSESGGEFDERCSAFKPSFGNNTESRQDDIDLSICYNIVQHHKGTIQFKNSKKGGNRLTLNFPVWIDGQHT